MTFSLSRPNASTGEPHQRRLHGIDRFAGLGWWSLHHYNGETTFSGGNDLRLCRRAATRLANEHINRVTLNVAALIRQGERPTSDDHFIRLQREALVWRIDYANQKMDCGEGPESGNLAPAYRKPNPTPGAAENLSSGRNIVNIDPVVERVTVPRGALQHQARNVCLLASQACRGRDPGGEGVGGVD